jgi:hypothetical protein
MAVIKKSMAGNEGKVVTCLEFVGPIGFIQHKGHALRMDSGDYWRVDRDLNLTGALPGEVHVDFIPYVPDAFLMPISGYKEPQQVKEEEGEPA